MVQQVWLVTGCSSGFGEQFVKTIIQRGDKAIATARRLESIKHLGEIGADTLPLDVTATPEQLAEKVKQAISFYGHIDVVIHNAGYGLIGAMEDLSYDALSAQYNTNVFGVMSLTQAIMPHFRERKTGCNVLISSLAAYLSVPGMGAYCSSKSAVEGLYRCLDLEVRPLGIKTLIMEPGTYRTEIRNPAKTNFAETEHYKPMMDGYKEFMEKSHGTQDGDTEKFVNLTIDLVKGEGCAEGKEVPLALPAGPDAYAMIKQRLELELKSLDEWADVIKATNYDGASGSDEAAAAPWVKAKA